MALSAGQLFAGYEILCELGRGGMGTVYQARQVSLQRVVALKILPPHLADDQDFIARFQAEAIAAAHLNHPNIVHVYTAGEAEGIDYIAMEYIQGETIQQRLRRCGRLPLTEALDVAFHVATALGHAWQSAQLIHRDVKPDNIFLTQNGTVKLGDFGLAKFLREGASSVTVTGHILGSPHFISPEQARGLRDTDWRSDIYSLGCTLHYMMTGRTVFEGPDFMSVMYKHVNEPPASIHTLLPNCPAVVNQLLAKMIAKDREQRHHGYASLIDEIIHARDEAAWWEQGDERQRRRMAVAVAEPIRGRSGRVYALAVLAALLVAGSYVYAKRGALHRLSQSAATLADPSDRRDFVQAVQRLTPADGLDRVMNKLRELNPQFDGNKKYTVEDDVVTELSFSSVGVRNLWPLCALQHLRVLNCAGDASGRRRGDLEDLSPLAELEELEELDCSWTAVENLHPLAKLPLNTLLCSNTRVANLVPLQGLSLVELDCSGTATSDLSPLKGMPLRSIRCLETKVRDLSPLHGAPLKNIRVDPRLFHGEMELLRSWSQLETINGVPPREAGATSTVGHPK